jgi:transcriptional regulator with XRE-family HTH domain
MAYINNREFVEHLFKQEKRNEYVDALVEEVRRLREENELLQKQLAEKIYIKLRTDEDVLTPKEAIQTINRLRKAYRKTIAQLAASQRREKVAMEEVCRRCSDGEIIDGLKHYPCDGCKWRGPKRLEVEL